MSPLRFLAAARLSARRIRAGGSSSSARRLLHHHQSRNHAGGAKGSGFSARLPMGSSIAAAGALCAALIGAKLYLRKHRQQPPTSESETSAWELSDRNAATLEEVIAEEQDLVKEADMKARFEEWMVKYGRRYGSEEEKAMRYREFKRHCKNAERANMLCRGSTTFGPNHLADSTDEEWQCRKGSERDPTLAHRLGYPYRRALELWQRALEISLQVIQLQCV